MKEKKKGKVALLTMFNVPNYGSFMQAFATIKVINDLGYECDVIDYKFPNAWHINKSNKGLGKIKRYLRPIAMAFGWRPRNYKDAKYLKSIYPKYFNLTSSFTKLKDLESYDWSGYEVIILGSDQVWNPGHMKGDKAFLLSFVPDNIPIISISSSFGCKNIEACHRENYYKYLNRFKSISVREEEGIEVLEQLKINVPSRVLIDPTLLLPRYVWLSKFPYEKEEGDYILIYYLAYSFKESPEEYIISLIKQFNRDSKKKVIILGVKPQGILNLVKNSTYIESPTVNHFLNLIANSKLVITTSFHGTAFALNFQKPMISVIPSNKEDSRQRSLLKMFGLERLSVSTNEPIDLIDPYYDSTIIESKLDKVRKEYKKWIQNAIINC